MRNRKVEELKKYRGILTTQQLRTLKGQILKGDVEGAQNGLNKMLRRIQNGNKQ